MSVTGEVGECGYCPDLRLVVTGGGVTSTKGEEGEPDIQECRDMLTGVTDSAGEVETRGPGKGEAGV